MNQPIITFGLVCLVIVLLATILTAPDRDETREGTGTAKLITMQDGTKCALWYSGNSGSIHCNWGDK